ncbi:hypothetical protein SAMN06265348_112142 [Pedobacter westerhofensis]|uniref:Uncharacterized protein n=1 Tax=Pedobacter westerhofensis TaxID=425512 RepID=A0A521FH98_9SPHI|nr:hypothetical protein SAMN06265348_112142 [Pedobacter westerhofensis]
MQIIITILTFKTRNFMVSGDFDVINFGYMEQLITLINLFTF